MSKNQRIRIRPFAIADAGAGIKHGDARLSIEVNGRVLPLTKYIEIVGEIVPDREAGWRRDLAAPKM